jgi:biopolymer transport protein ExbD
MELLNKKITSRNLFGGAILPRRANLTLRMAPMIDMIFLLLIFFLVAAKWRPKEDFLPLQFPGAAQASLGALAKPEPLTIQISSTASGCLARIAGAYSVQIGDPNVEQNLSALMETVRTCLSEQKRLASDPVEIICAPNVKWEHLTLVYNALYGMGITDITFQMTEPPKNETLD